MKQNHTPKVTELSVNEYLESISVRKTSLKTYRNYAAGYQRSITTGTTVDESELGVHRFLNKYENPRSHNLAYVVVSAYRKYLGLPAVKRKRKAVTRHEFNTARIADAVPRMIASCKTFRDRFLIIMLRYSGLRIGEATRLKKEHCSFPNGQLLVNVPDQNTKTGFRPVLAWKASRDAKEYLPGISDGGWLFPGTRDPAKRWTQHEAERMFQRASTAAGYHVTPHDLRRLWETEMAGQYGVAVLKDYFGQKSAEIVDIYIDMALGQSKTAIMGDLGFEKKSSLFSKVACWKCGMENDVSVKECRACHESLEIDLIPHKKEIDAMDEPELKDYVLKLARKFGVL